MITVHKGFQHIFQALVLALLMVSSVAAATSTDMTSVQARKAIAQAAKKKDFSQEFIQMTKASTAVEMVLLNVLQTSSNRWEERWFSAIVLGKRNTPPARKALLQAAKDPLFIVRQAAVQGLSYFDDPETMQAIRDALNDTAMVVRSEAVDAIMKRGDSDAIALLEKELYTKHNFQKGRSMWIRPQIIHAFGKLGDPGALNILMRTLQDKDAKVVTQSCKSLQTLSMKNQWEYPVATKACAATWVRWYQNRQAKSAPAKAATKQ